MVKSLTSKYDKVKLTNPFIEPCSEKKYLYVIRGIADEVKASTNAFTIVENYFKKKGKLVLELDF